MTKKNALSLISINRIHYLLDKSANTLLIKSHNHGHLSYLAIFCLAVASYCSFSHNFEQHTAINSK